MISVSFISSVPRFGGGGGPGGGGDVDATTGAAIDASLGDFFGGVDAASASIGAGNDPGSTAFGVDTALGEAFGAVDATVGNLGNPDNAGSVGFSRESAMQGGKTGLALGGIPGAIAGGIIGGVIGGSSAGTSDADIANAAAAAVGGSQGGEPGNAPVGSQTGPGDVADKLRPAAATANPPRTNLLEEEGEDISDEDEAIRDIIMKRGLWSTILTSASGLQGPANVRRQSALGF